MRTHSGLLVRRTRLFGLLKQQFGSRLFHNNKKLETDVREWLQMQEPDVCRDDTVKLIPGWNTLTYSGVMLKIIIPWNKLATFNVVGTSHLIVMTQGTLLQEYPLVSSSYH